MGLFKKNKKNSVVDGTQDTLSSLADEEIVDDVFHGVRKSVRDRVAPDGINPNPLEYMEIMDGATKSYVSVYYISSMPKTSTFAQTFAPLFNMAGVTSSVYTEPVPVAKTRKLLNKRIIVLDGERVTASKNDMNRERVITEKLEEAEKWAKEVETGVNAIFKVAFLFTITAESLEDLHTRTEMLVALGREKGMELVNAYSVVPEAFLCNAPFGKLYDFNVGPYRKKAIKLHIMDKRSLSNIYNHTQAGFSYPDGVLFGRNLFSGRPVFYNPFRHTHGYGMAISGMIGSGKSTTVKILLGRTIDHGAKVVSIDYDSPGNVNGEYCQLAYEEGGYIFQLRSDTETPINLFELSPTKRFDDIRHIEYETLDLKEKIQDLSNIIVTIIKSGKSEVDFEIDVFLKEKVTDTISELYAERGIVDRDVSSLYEMGEVLVNGKVMPGKVRKKLPTISDFTYKILVEQATNRNDTYDLTYALILAGIKQYVKELYFCPDTLKRFTAEEFKRLAFDDGGSYYKEGNEKHYVKALKGIKPYFDGESCLDVDIASLSMVNFDLSQLPESERLVAQLVVMNYITENFVKSNAADPSKVEDRYFVIDEAHRGWVYAEAQRFCCDVSRTCRKKHVSPVTITQSVSDYGKSKETETIFKLAVCKILLKHDYMDEEYILKNTILNEYQTRRVLNLGGDASAMEFADESMRNARQGECCMIDGNRVQFIKVDRLPSEIRFSETDAAMRKKLVAGKA